MASKGPPDPVPGQGVEGVRNVERHADRHPALLHGGLNRGSDPEDRICCTAMPPESELVPMQVGIPLFQVTDEAASYNALEELGLLVDQTDRPVTRRGVCRFAILPEENQFGPPPRLGKHSATQAVIKYLPEVARGHGH